MQWLHDENVQCAQNLVGKSDGAKDDFADPIWRWKTGDFTKGQLNSEWIYEVIVSSKMQTKNYKDFCHTKQS